MLKENALVIGYKDGVATVVCQAKSACGHCASKSVCGTGALSELTGELGEHMFNILSITPVKEGQVVEIGLRERSLIISTLLLYAIPLLTLLVSTFVAEYLFDQELISALFILFSTSVSFLVVHFYTKNLQKKSNYQPILLRVIG